MFSLESPDPGSGWEPVGVQGVDGTLKGGQAGSLPPAGTGLHWNRVQGVDALLM